MNSYIILGCLLAVAGVQCNPVGVGGYGWGGGWGLGGHVWAPAVSTANLVKAAPIPVIRHVISAPVIAPISVPVVKTVSVGSWGGLGGYGHGGYGLGGYGHGGYGHGGYGHGGYGLGGYGYGGYGLGGHGLGVSLGHGWGHGGKIYG